MPAISKIRFTNVIYENGAKRYNDDIFEFDGYNGAILLENGGGKTVFIQTALQAVLPHVDLAERKIKNTLSLEGNPCHIAIEWILHERPRRYALTAVTLFLTATGIDSYRYVYEYGSGDNHGIEHIPFVRKAGDGKNRPASKGEILDYYQYMQQQSPNGHVFKTTIKEYQKYIEENFHIIPSEWQSIARINSAEGDVESFFDGCKTTSQLVDQLLIPVVEDALAGNGTQDFVETFEKQREHFKKHRQLRGRIEESQRVADAISQYVQCFAGLHEAKEELMKKKQTTKALYHFVQAEKRSIHDQLTENRNQHILWEQSTYDHKRKEASYELSLLENRLKEAKEQYEQTKGIVGRTKGELGEKEQRLQNLEVAELKKKLQEQDELVAVYEKQLHHLNQDQQAVDLKEQLEENAAAIKGYFVREEEHLEKAKITFQGEESRYFQELKQAEKDKDILEDEKAALETEKTTQKANIRHAETEMAHISKEILDHVHHEKVEEEQTKWQERLEEVERQSAIYRTLLSQLKTEKGALQQTIPTLSRTLQELKKVEGTKRQGLNILEKEHDSLLIRLKAARGDWRFIKSLYERQATIVTLLEEKTEKTRLEKEKLIQEERIAYRLQDDYGTHEYFTAEPLLAEWISRWSQQFYLLETGGQYLERAAGTLERSIEELYEAYPLWSMAIVTSMGEVDKLKQRVEQQIGSLTYPVLILSDEEAKRILQEGRVTKERYVFPDHWRNNIEENGFKTWKIQIQQTAQNATRVRKEKEKEQEDWKRLLDDAQLFFEQYPHEYSQQLQKEIREIEQEIQDQGKLLQQKEDRNIALDEEMDRSQKKLSDFEQEVLILGYKMKRAHDYLNKKKMREKAFFALREAEEKAKKKEQEILQQKSILERCRNILEDVKEEIRKIIDQSIRLKDDSLYQEVYGVQPVFTKATKKSLEIQRKALKDQLDEKQKGRRELEGLLSTCLAQKEDLQKLMERTRRKVNKYPIDESILFPLHGEKDIETLTSQINQLNQALDKLQPRYMQLEDEYKGNLNTYHLRKQDYHNSFEEIILFAKPLQEIKGELDEEKESLLKQKNYLAARYEQLDKEESQIQEVIQELEKKHERYGYLASEVMETALPQEMEQEFPYKRKQWLQNMIVALEDLTSMVENMKSKVEHHRQGFIQNCNTSVQDVRLREMAVTGIRNKTEYHDIIEWQKKMDQRILRTIELVEGDMREHDQQLQQFIQYLHTYLHTLAQELRMIPKNTRVRVDEGWKEIFSFDVPVWDDQEGKEELRKHIDWMLSRLESDEFKDEQGNENQALVKKSIEKWMESRQLLKNVMKERTIKIKCRKVTNDNKIIGSLFSWETSNLWSGGEKWSKNMALFLGILNYVAEKRQHIIISKKRNRTVILDNPFGKASSEHVLQPVFFIAEQLGFQIIALTAHAEGKFIRDYFPVVYSCKLRSTVDGLSAVMGKEKIIHYAFFQDHDPQALVRIGEQEQLTLF
ncbi:MAG: hypothetical protein K0R93_3155 [Anaerosolibacter sp.]|jgi:hypothetical protein|uniref:hypothetical protein n=1 Tax=Anaerosolibacter sp. TaxID=1872527 RepID=UPI00262218CA|nr:hypothetical protein [Anaerosolibacter sp.]MDF2548257.1 hypothetical protein [Anaerosolibacter sp.]